MKYFIRSLIAFTFVSLCMLAHAETDVKALKVISDIQKGEQNNNAIVDLYVVDDATIGGDVAVAGNLTISGTQTNADVAVDSITVDDVQLFGYQSDTNETIDVFTITPDGIGQLLWGTASNEWYISHGTTTNDWDHLN